MNVVVIAGRLSGPPAEKVLPSGTRIMSMQVTVAGGTGRADSVPVAWFDPPAVAVELDEGDEVVVLGRVRRRFFRAGAGTQSRTEVVADRVIPARRAASVRTALAAAVERLASGLEPGQGKAPEQEVRRRSRAG
ncbi:MAG TPA: single-stranded DNA-binding protein [Acidimicrobiales bacterium]|nr:single-stranded DNA-binding protein [Acidimicrobiales bacterium]